MKERRKNERAGKMFCRIWLAVFIALAVTMAYKTEASADTLTMTVERFSIGGGFLVEPTVAEFTPGETYGDVLKRVLDSKGISPSITQTQYGPYLEGILGADTGWNPPECVKTVLEGLNMKAGENKNAPNLSEFSYTQGAGWMYYVNNVYVPVGIGVSQPKDGDVARFMFTLCYGADLTGQANENMGMEGLPSSMQWYQPIDKSSLVRVMGEINKDRARWENAPGFQEAYQKASAVMAQMDYADEYELSETIALLEDIGKKLPPLPEAVKLDKEKLELQGPGKSEKLSCSFVPENAVSAVSWGSENPGVAEVNDGVVTSKSSGTTVVYVQTANGKRAECKVTVLPSQTAEPTQPANPTPPVNPQPTGGAEEKPVQSIAFTRTSCSIDLVSSPTITLEYVLTPVDAKTSLKWESSNPAVAEVNAGQVTGKKAGETDITVTTDNGKAAVCHVTVVSSAKDKDAFISGQPVMKAVYSGQAVQLSWEPYENASSYRVLRMTAGSGKFERLASVNALSYTDQTAEAGKSYTYTIQAAADKWGGEIESQMAKPVYIDIAGEKEPAPVTVGSTAISKITSPAYNKLKLTWSRAENATGYILYRSTSAVSGYKAVKTIAKETTLTYTDTNIKTGTVYYYKVRAIHTENGTTVNGTLSVAKGKKAVLAKPSVKTTAGKKKAAVKWGRVSGASGYTVYRAAARNGKYKAVYTAKKGGAGKYMNTRLKSKKTYFYKVRAYRMADGRKVWSADSAVKSVRVK